MSNNKEGKPFFSRYLHNISIVLGFIVFYLFPPIAALLLKVMPVIVFIYFSLRDLV